MVANVHIALKRLSSLCLWVFYSLIEKLKNLEF